MSRNPDIEKMVSLTLYTGQRVKHEVVYGVVTDRNTGQFHHDYAHFKTFRQSKQQPWKLDPRASFTLSEDKEKALSQALSFLQDCRQSPAAQATPEIDAAQLVQYLCSAERGALINALENLPPENLQEAALRLEIASKRQALRQWKRLLKHQDATALETHLQQHIWLLGPDTEPPLITWALDIEPLFELHAASWVPVVSLNHALSQAHMHWSGYGDPTLKMLLIVKAQSDPQQTEALMFFNEQLKHLQILPTTAITERAYTALAQLQQR